MKATLDSVTREAMALSTAEKAILAETIVRSLVSQPAPALKRKQLATVMRRREELLSGKVQGVSVADVVREIQALLA